MSQSRIVCLVSILVLGQVLAQDSALPKTWKICKRTDKNLNSCLKSAIGGAVKDLAKGNKELGVPPIEPMHFDTIIVDQGAGPVGVRLKFTNLNIHGLSKAIIDKARVDYDKLEFDIDFHVDEPVRMQGDYVSSGRVLVIPINGVGKSNMTFENFRGKLNMKGKEVKKGKDTYYSVEKVDINIDTTRLYLSFKRIKQDAISSVLNRFLNENWREILTDMKPGISKSFGSNIKETANSVFSKIPLSVIAAP